jgi:HlyD family secretion protein
MIDDGDEVRAGEPIAILDSHAQEEATVQRLQAELENANRECARNEKLSKKGIVSDSELDDRRTKTTMIEAELARAKAEREQSVVRAPITGRVIEVHARAGEKVGPDGIAELGRTDIVNAIAEVYETDIGKVRLGQRAVVASPALPAELHGTVSRIGRKIGKKDVLATDPAADTDARVVEVEIRLDDPSAAADLTNLRVDVAISAAPQ